MAPIPSSTDPHPIIAVVCGVIRNEVGEFLACLRPAGKHLGGCWEFPGGKVEDGENHAEALERELLEELSIRIIVREALTPVLWDYGSRWIRLHPYLCLIDTGTPAALEHAEVRWVGREELPALAWAAADIPIVEELLRSAP